MRQVFSKHASPDQPSQSPVAYKKLPTAFPLIEINLEHLPAQMNRRTEDGDEVVDRSQAHGVADVGQGRDKDRGKTGQNRPSG